METDRAVAILERQIQQIDEMKSRTFESPEFGKWRRDTEVAIEKIFGREGRNISDFKRIGYSSPGPLAYLVVSGYAQPTPPADHEASFNKGLEEARHILRSMVEELINYSAEADPAAPGSVSDRLVRLFDRFHLVARQLRVRHNKRATLEIKDEYDVQDLLHALLRIDFGDVRREEGTPSHAGTASRMDFLLKEERVVIEVKKTREGLAGREVTNQLIEDIERYQVHPDCSALFCFVYDPEGRILNAEAIESGLRRTEPLPVHVLVRPKSV